MPKSVTLKSLRAELRDLADPEIAEHSQRFFKTAPGQYGHGDKFLGIRVGPQRKVARAYQDLALADVLKLLKSKLHEERLVALLILVRQYQRGGDKQRERIYKAYLANTQWVNNWDLVDSSAHLIVGPHLDRRSKQPLTRLAKSASLWERRIAIIATLHYIKAEQYDETLRIAKLLLADDHDLIHKAVGWMLREVGNRERAVLEDFLKPRYQQMPRTMLRYAIERFPESKRKRYLQGRRRG